MSVEIGRCGACGRRFFPQRELCPYCAARDVGPQEVERGIVAEATTHRGVRIACVRIDGDVALLARLEGEPAAGTEVALRLEGGAIVASAAT